MIARHFSALFTGMLLLLACLNRAIPGDAIHPITGTFPDSVSGSGPSSLPIFSGDGGSVLFLSRALNLTTNDLDGDTLNLFILDRATREIRLLSASTNGTAGANRDAAFPSISTDGRRVAFASAASNFVPGDTNGASDIFVRDLISNQTTCVSLDIQGELLVDPEPTKNEPLSCNPQLSGNGRWLVFEGRATNLTHVADPNNGTDVYARDLHAGITIPVSITAAGSTMGSGVSHTPAITPTADRVAFISRAADLVPHGPTNSAGDVYVRTLASSNTVWLSAAVADYLGQPTNGYSCFEPAISADGRFVAFKAAAPNAWQACVVCYDLETDTSLLITTNASTGSAVHFSANARRLVYDNDSRLYTRDLQTSDTWLVDAAADETAPATGNSHSPRISPDGNQVVFVSSASNLLAGKTVARSQVYMRDLLQQTTHLVTRSPQGEPSARDHDDAQPVFSPDGSWVAFSSRDYRLTTGDANMVADVYLHRWDSGITELASTRRADRPCKTSEGRIQRGRFFLPNPDPRQSHPYAFAISSNGTKLVFSSYDRGPAYGDVNGRMDIYIADLAAGTIAPISLGVESPEEFFGANFEPVISANGRYLAFGREAARIESTNMVNTVSILRHDLETGAWQIAASNLPPLQRPFTGGSTYDRLALSISPEGRYVAYHTRTNVVLADMEGRPATTWQAPGHDPLLSPNGRWMIYFANAMYVRDLESGTFWKTSIATQQFNMTYSAIFSPDSKYLAVTTQNTMTVYDYQFQTNMFAMFVYPGYKRPTFSGDGAWITYEAGAIYRKNLLTLQETLVSVDQTGTLYGNSNSVAPQISADGRYVVFLSQATNLVSNDPSAEMDIYVRDMTLGTTLRVSGSLNEKGGIRRFLNPMICPNGRTVIFQSAAADLAAGDMNGMPDLFILELGERDTDADGLPDDWEISYFGDLAADRTTDHDQDGQTDYQEYWTGTDPTNRGSVLQVLTFRSNGSNHHTLIWAAIPGKTYQVQYKADLRIRNWNNVAQPVKAQDSTATLIDTNRYRLHRFYRVLALP